MKIRILKSALEDLVAARGFYDQQQAGVGSYFFASLFSEIDSLAINAGIHPIRLGYHRLLARRFPYAVYYRLSGSEVLVYRVLDCRRDPNWIRRALR
ncbi:MAG: type II toxin-antitoxin system RelE/ParE family toxin [Opitutaceae bacterium]|nr:type II toxin-antitoxin system RelE/ParE family toxin [Opitutaceae bacterium]MBP9912499.1 type II toxin-antitoxin system RelE/ParE family toxin [Opitutaceae bacterium]